MKPSFFTVFGIFSLGLCMSLAGADLASEYANSAALDEAETVNLYWSVDWPTKTVSFAVAAKTTGWIGFGISTGRGQMIGADLVIGWVKDGKAYFEDRYASGYRTPEVDASQDYELISLNETGGVTTMKFKRKIDTCDSKDLKILEGTSKVIFAYNPSDPSSPDAITKHTVRGARSVMLLNTGTSKPNLPPNMKYIDLLNNQTKVPLNKTTYWCNAFELPRLGKKHHVVKVEPIIQKGHEGLVHHIVVYECPMDFPTGLLNHSGPCYSRSTPEAIMRCAGESTLLAWAIGGGNFYFPDHVGLNVGTDDSPRYLVTETHYDNPEQKTDFVDSSGLRLWYTDQTRTYDAGIIYAGWAVAYQMMIPPRETEWTTSGYCPSVCSKKGLEKSPLEGGGVKIFSGLPHTHVAGRAVRVKHLRDGNELEEVMYDDNYDFNFQEFQTLKEEVDFMPGDELIVTCTYNSKKLQTPILGGLGTKEEMCLAFLMYYPKLNLTKCATRDKQPAEFFFYKHFWNGTHGLPFPPKVWSNQMTTDLRKLYEDSKQVKVSCVGRNNKRIEGAQGATVLKPKIDTPFKPEPSPCDTNVESAAGDFKPEMLFTLLVVMIITHLV